MPRFMKRPVMVTAERVRTALILPSLEGDMRAALGDWIVTGVRGERYPVKDGIFRATYAAVDREGELALAEEV